MNSFIAFIAVCTCWSFSWYCIKIQSSCSVEIIVSVFYRMLGVAIVLFVMLSMTKRKIKISQNEIKNMAIIGFINACFNFVFVYKASLYVPSGIIATMSATTIFMSEFIISIYKKRKPNPIILLTSITGAIGMLILFQHNLLKANFSLANFLTGITYCIIANLALSLNFIIVSVNYEKNKTNALVTLCYSSFFGATVLISIIAFLRIDISFAYSAKYIFSLFYLTIFASVIAYSCVYYLNTTIGPAKTGYTALVYTPTSMIISTIFEGWYWHFTCTIGLVIILLSVILGLKAKN